MHGFPEGATACNCTACRRYGALWAYGHEGEEFVYVLSGRVEFILDSDQFYDLGVGDSLYFESKRRHAWTNRHDGETVLLWVNTPPTF